jgi:hypothetical protein
VTGEIGVRVLGMVDFPLFAVDEEIGYVPKPNQRGCFLNRRCWVFNDYSMGTTAAWSPNAHTNILLIGNSIVMGGDHFDQPERLGPLLQTKLGDGFAVWPIASNGWTNVNEIVYFERHPDVLARANCVVWEFMRGGLSSRTPWAGQYVWPEERPLWALGYVLRRFILPRLFHIDTHELPMQGAPDPRNLANFEATLARFARDTDGAHPDILFLYPDKEQLRLARSGGEWLPERRDLERLARQYHFKLVDIASYAQWTESLYREETHPGTEGNRVLADILSTAIRESQQ